MKRFEHSGSRSAFFPIPKKKEIARQPAVKDLRTFFKDTVEKETIAKETIEQIIAEALKSIKP